MKNIFKIYFITALLLFISSCVDVGKSAERKQSGATGSTDSKSKKEAEEKAEKAEEEKSAKEEPAEAEKVKEEKSPKEEPAEAKKAKEETEANKIEIVGENKYFKVSKQAGKTSHEIKKAVDSPVLIKNDGTVVENQDLDKISDEDFSKLSHVILPDSNPLIKQITENPFINEALITPARLLYKNKLLKSEKIENGSVLLKLESEGAEDKILDETKMKELFGDFKREENLLGKGGMGSVYKVNYKGQDYALKIGTYEYEELEVLQSTGAVAKVFGTFSYDNKPCMLMEIGQKSLADMNKNGEKLTNDQLTTAIASFTKLIGEEKKIGIENKDIKPDNLLLTNDNKLVVIDISSSAETTGYTGTEGKKFAISLLENKKGISLASANKFITKESLLNPDQKTQGVYYVAPYVIAHWSKKVCVEILLPKVNCDAIKTPKDFFDLIPPEKREELAQQKNEEIKQENEKNIHHKFKKKTLDSNNYNDVMGVLAEKYPQYTVEYLVDDIFNNELDKNDEVNKGLIELYNL